MRRKKQIRFPELVPIVEDRLRGPLCVAMGSPGEVVDVLAALDIENITCYQMDLFQAARIGPELEEFGLEAKVRTLPDLWDLERPFPSVLFPVPIGGERALKLDIIEQAYHILEPGGTFVVLSPYEKDDLFQPALKKVFGKVHCPMEGQNRVFWCQRDDDRPRRRHEMHFHVRVDEGVSYDFVSRPGAFSYGRFDMGARALCEAMEIPEGARVADLGCGVGTNGILAARKAGPRGFIAFVDSNVRAIALTELNAKNLGVPHFKTYATATASGLDERSFDVVLANPPYIAQMTVARMFMERGQRLLKKGGTFYLVSKQIDAIHPHMEEVFPGFEIFENRGYFIFTGQA